MAPTAGRSARVAPPRGEPSWWAMFARQDMDREALLNDAESLAEFTSHPTIEPRKERRSTVHTFTFPAQDFKLKVGDSPLRSGTLEPAGDIVSLDEAARVIELKLGPSRSPLEPGSALIPIGPIGDALLRAAIHRYAEHVSAGGDGYHAITSVLRRDRSRLAGILSGEC